MLNLKYNSDIRTLVFEAIYFALIYYQWCYNATSSFPLKLLLWIATCHFSFLGAVATHNCIHLPMFKSGKLNSIFQLILTETMGHPVSTLVPGHNLSHHKYLQSRKDVMRTYNFKYKWHALNLLLFTASIQGRMQRNDWKYFMAQREKGRPIWNQIKLEFTFHILCTILYIIVDWKKWLLIIFLPQLYAKNCIAVLKIQYFEINWWLNILQHDGCDETSEIDFARNFVGKHLNFWAYNNGYHSIHHIYPGKHWSVLPELHDKLLKPTIHPNLDQESILGYMWTTFIAPGERLRYDGSPFVWPKDKNEPPIDWAFNRNDTHSTEDEKTDVYLARKSAPKPKEGSKYRHVVAQPFKRDMCYTDLRPNTNSGDGSVVACSGSFVAINWQGGGGTAAVIPFGSWGERKDSFPLLHAHKTSITKKKKKSCTITEMRWNSFNHNILSTGDDAGSIKLWKFENEGLKEDKSDSLTELRGHKKRIECLKFHPTANNILVSSSNDKTAKLWDIEASSVVQSFEFFGDFVHGCTWNYDGSLLAFTCKDKKLRIVDPRSNEVVQQTESHPGLKPSKVVWLGNRNRIMTTGFSRMRNREFNFWDSTNLEKPLKNVQLDSSQGIIDPFYDIDSELLILCAKGDTIVKVCEFTDKSPNYYNELTACNTQTPSLGQCMIPKTMTSVMDIEVARLLKVTNDSISPVGFFVPRKTKHNFQDDLYPDTAGSIPALTAQEWLSGENRVPVLVSLDPSSRGVQQSEIPKEQNSFILFISDPKKDPVFGKKPEEEVRLKFDGRKMSAPQPKVDRTPIEEQIKKQEVVEEKRTFNVPKIVRSSKYRHISQKATRKEFFFDGLNVDQGSSSNSFIEGNSRFFAVPWKGSGGLVGILDLSEPGRINDEKVTKIELGSKVQDFCWNPFNDFELITGAEDGHIKLWKIDDEIVKSGSNLSNPFSDLAEHRRKISTLKYHPTSNGIFVSSGLDHLVKIWDIESGSSKFNIECHEDTILSTEFNYDGSLLATASKDKNLRILDPRTEKCVAQTIAHQSPKGFKTCWLGNRNQILTVGFSKSSERQICVWDAQNLEKPIKTTGIDQLPGIITPIYDEATSIIALAGKGDGAIKFYELTDVDPFLHHLSDYSTPNPQLGVSILPKTYCDVKICEIMHLLKLTNSGTVEQIQITVPRTRTEFFQDDVFVPARANEPSQSSNDWFSGQNSDPLLVSLQPEGMTKLSDAPAVVKPERKYASRTNDEEEETSAQDVQDKWAQMFDDHQNNDKPLPDADVEGVDSDEWSDD